MMRVSTPINTQTGLSLVELMIAMMLGVVIVLGGSQLYASLSQTYRYNEAVSRMHESSSFALHYIGQLVRKADAGGAGCVGDDRLTNWVDESRLDEMLPDLVSSASLYGWDYTGTGQGEQFELPQDMTSANNNSTALASSSSQSLPDAIEQDSVTGSDVLLISHSQSQQLEVSAGNANSPGQGQGGGQGGGQGQGGGRCPGGGGPSGGQSIQFDTDDTTQGFPEQGDLVMFTQGCEAADLLRKTNASDSTVTKGGNFNESGSGFCGQYEAGATISISTVEQIAFYVALNGRGEPALFRETINEDAGERDRVELIEGVESLQVTYGENESTDGNGQFQVAQYRDASQVEDWDRVISVRLGLLFRTPDRVSQMSEAESLQVNATHLNTPEDERVRQVGVKTVAIRERVE